MKTIFDIFKNDINAIVKFFFVLVIVLALGTLPSLYAWINIYANWDPYAQAGDVQVALSSRDPGIDLRNGTHVNSSKEVIADVKDDEDIGYRPIDDPDEAVRGVESGRYYAAIIFEDGFTYDMHNYEEAIGDRQPKITYYTNIKKNAVASKVTDAAAEKLLEEINSKYVKEMMTRYFGDTRDAVEDLDTEEAIDDALEQLIGARDALHDYNGAIAGLMSAKGNVTQSIKNAENNLDKGRKDGSSDIASAKEKIEEAKTTIRKVQKQIDTETGKLKTAINDLRSIVKQLQGPVDEQTRAKLAEEGVEAADRVLTLLQDLRAMLPVDPKTTAGRVSADAMDVMISQTEHIVALIESDPTSPEILSDVDTIKKLLSEDLKPSLKLMISEIKSALEKTNPLLKAADGVLDDIEPVLESAGSTVEGIDSSLGGLQVMLTSLETKLDDVIEQVEAADETDKAKIIAEFLGGDPKLYSEFFTSLIQVKAEELFKPVSYGAAMTPFYTIIALWVGGVMLVTLLNTNVDRRRFPGATEAQCFFGRFLIFFLIGQIQAAVVVFGNIFLLHCSPVHPWLMWLSASITSMVFVSLIYALTLAFGDIGRAAVIVIMMVQIAGSSGTYPIEILPDIFEKIYRFFPFPYAINAMRETICGMYGHDFLIYLAQLLIFFLCAIAIGVFVRKPFVGVKAFMAEKMKETEVM